MFWKNERDNKDKKVVNSDEYERLLKRILDTDARMSKVENDFKLLQTDLDNLRGNFNRKLKGLADEEIKKITQQNESFNNSNEVAFG